MKNHEAKEAINATEVVKTDVVQTNEPETAVEEKKPFWTKRKKIVAGVIAGTIIGGILLRRFVRFDLGDVTDANDLLRDAVDTLERDGYSVVETKVA